MVELLDKAQDAFDMYTHAHIIYPAKNVSLKYDFNFMKDGVWYYINSSDRIGAFAENGQTKVAKQGWRIVETSTGKIV